MSSLGLRLPLPSTVLPPSLRLFDKAANVKLSKIRFRTLKASPGPSPPLLDLFACLVSALSFLGLIRRVQKSSLPGCRTADLILHLLLPQFLNLLTGHMSRNNLSRSRKGCHGGRTPPFAGCLNLTGGCFCWSSSFQKPAEPWTVRSKLTILISRQE